NWHDSGYKTIDEVEKAQEEYKRSKETSGQSGNGSFDVNEFFELALKNSYNEMRSHRKDEGE
ncbi:MAG: hypothetical protein IJT91_05765, partial [Clostridia bacterium]|nr:hypothetical protein [Clostridia bacterium]